MTETVVKQYLLTRRAAVIWVQNVLQEESLGLDVKDDFFHQIVDGVILCKVMQKIAPNLIPRIKMPAQKKRATLTIFKTNENVSFFVQACTEIGVPRQKRFVLHDLVNKKGVSISYASSRRVLECLEALCELANSDKRYEFSVKWPNLDPNREKFSKEDTANAQKMVEDFIKTEEKKEFTERLSRPSSNRFDSPADDAKRKELMRHKAASRLQAVVRGWLARNRYRTMVRSQAYRDHVAQEILSTERVYVEHLEFLVKEVLQPLRHAGDILTEVEIRAIFSETESILNYNRILLAQLEERVGKWKVSQRLGDSFLLISNYLKIYSQYCSNYNEAMRVLSECKKQTKFKKFLDELKKKCHDIEHRGLEDYLIRPVQRIPRYYLLLQDLVKHTSKDHPDYANLYLAAQKVQAVAEHMNIKKREAENILKVTEIQEMIDGEYPPLAKPHRRYVRDGQLQEVTKGTTRKLPVVLFLFNDMLVVTKPQGSSFLARSKAPRLHFYAEFPLAGTQTISLDNSSVFQNAFQVIRIKSKRSITVLASSHESKEEWLTAINNEIAGASKIVDEQDTRKTSAVKDKVTDTLAKLETFYHSSPGLSSSSHSSHSIISPASSPAPLSPTSPASPASPVSPPLLKSQELERTSSSLSASSDSDGDGATRRMSVRDKRMQLMQSARRSGSLPGSPMLTGSTE